MPDECVEPLGDAVQERVGQPVGRQRDPDGGDRLAVLAVDDPALVLSLIHI